MANRVIGQFRALGAKVSTLFAGLCEFQQRIWVVSIIKDAYTDTFIVNEDSFEEPMQWMLRKGYSADLLQRVNEMRRSQVIQLELGDVSHRLMRVK